MLIVPTIGCKHCSRRLGGGGKGRDFLGHWQDDQDDTIRLVSTLVSSASSYISKEQIVAPNTTEKLP